MKQGGTFRVTIPVEITYDWYPEELETASEPRVYEYFNISSMKIGEKDITDIHGWSTIQYCVEDDVQEYLKQQALEELP